MTDGRMCRSVKRLDNPIVRLYESPSSFSNLSTNLVLCVIEKLLMYVMVQRTD
jgi:hypothetical protein